MPAFAYNYSPTDPAAEGDFLPVADIASALAYQSAIGTAIVGMLTRSPMVPNDYRGNLPDDYGNVLPDSARVVAYPDSALPAVKSWSFGHRVIVTDGAGYRQDGDYSLDADTRRSLAFATDTDTARDWQGTDFLPDGTPITYGIGRGAIPAENRAERVPLTEHVAWCAICGTTSATIVDRTAEVAHRHSVEADHARNCRKCEHLRNCHTADCPDDDHDAAHARYRSTMAQQEQRSTVRGHVGKSHALDWACPTHGTTAVVGAVLPAAIDGATTTARSTVLGRKTARNGKRGVAVRAESVSERVIADSRQPARLRVVSAMVTAEVLSYTRCGLLVIVRDQTGRVVRVTNADGSPLSAQLRKATVTALARRSPAAARWVTDQLSTARSIGNLVKVASGTRPRTAAATAAPRKPRATEIAKARRLAMLADLAATADRIVAATDARLAAR